MRVNAISINGAPCASKSTDMITDNYNDTICAISTPPGVGGIAVIRVSGPEAVAIVNSVWRGRDLNSVETHTAHLGELTEEGQEAIDQCVATVFRAPRSYTGEDTVELAIHGSKWIQREALSLLQRHGCRMAEAGEYTRRAVMNGRMDLAQAEGVADVIASSSRAAHRIAMNQMKGGISRRLAMLRERLVHLSVLLELELDFSEEDVEFADRTQLIDTAMQIRDELTRLYGSFRRGNAIKEGIPVAIVGATNAGKSSLLNTLLDDDRAIVSDIHGTTRDTIEETLEIGDYLFRFIDTAGLRATLDPIERIGIERSRKALSHARIIIALVDATTALEEKVELSALLPAELSGQDADIIVGMNKVDLLDETGRQRLQELISKSSAANLSTIIPLSAKEGHGIEYLRHAIHDIAAKDDNSTGEQADIMVTNLRQAEALRQALESLTPLISGLQNGLETDLAAQHLRETLTHLATITGEIPSTEILNTIFSTFCIGK